LANAVSILVIPVCDVFACPCFSKFSISIFILGSCSMNFGFSTDISKW
jgi:hypothetical protein